MKKIMIFAAAAALLSLSSCGKEEIKNVTDASSNGSPVFTASINPGTKTTVDAQDGTLAWENSDVITITDAAKNTATYYISGIDGSTGKATFEYSSGDELGAGPYSAVYGTQPEEAQTYSETAPGKLPMTASSQDNVLTFTVQCALMEINLTKEGESVKKIEVTGKPEGKNETTYTLTCTEAVSIAEKKAFYIALPAGTYTKIVITDSEDKVCTLNVKAEGIPVTVNQIIPATFDAEHLNFPQPTTGTAKATIGGSEVDVNWVQLWENGPKFAEYNVGATSTTDCGGYYCWGGTYKNGAGIPWTDDHNTGFAPLIGPDDTATNLWGGNWRMPTQAELEALLNPDNCTCTWTENYNGTGVNGLLCKGKDTGYASNSVFLPAAGRCNDDGFYYQGYYGYYWSSTPQGNILAYSLVFDSGSSSVNNDNRSFGYSVRAVLAE